MIAALKKLTPSCDANRSKFSEVMAIAQQIIMLLCGHMQSSRAASSRSHCGRSLIMAPTSTGGGGGSSSAGDPSAQTTASLASALAPASSAVPEQVLPPPPGVMQAPPPPSQTQQAVNGPVAATAGGLPLPPPGAAEALKIAPPKAELKAKQPKESKEKSKGGWQWVATTYDM